VTEGQWRAAHQRAKMTAWTRSSLSTTWISGSMKPLPILRTVGYLPRSKASDGRRMTPTNGALSLRNGRFESSLS
jgi:hypothetical protein